jgi:LuxR family maltose regulon positive regulatory protein
MDRSDALLTRWRLIDAIEGAGPSALVLLVAGAGSGKSTLLRQWQERTSAAAAVVSITDDQDAGRLAAAVATAVAEVVPDGSELRRRAAGREVDWSCDLVPRLLAVVADNPVTLALDDVHLIQSASGKELLSTLVWQWPEGCALVLSGRARPRVPLTRRQIGAPIRVLGEPDLDFDEAELRQLADAAGARFDPTELLERTGGWPAGLRLAVLAAGADGIPGSVDDYLRTQVLAAFDDDELDFLGHLAALAPAPASLLDLAQNRNDTLTTLRELVGRGLPMVDVPGDGDVTSPVVVHALLADVLVSRLRARQPGRVEAVVDLAIAAAERADELDYVLDLLDRHELTEQARVLPYRYMAHLVMNGWYRRLASWLDRYDVEQLSSDPMLVFPYSNVLRPRDEATVRALFARHAHDTTTVLPDGLTPPMAARRLLVAYGLAPADPDDTELLGGWRQCLGVQRAWDLYAADRLEEADEQLVKLEGSAHKYAVTNSVRLAKRSIIALEEGRVDEAVELVGQARRIIEDGRMDETALSFLVDAATIKLARREGDLDGAERAATAARTKMAMVGDGTMLQRVTTLIEIGHLYLDLGHGHPTEELLVEAEAILGRWPGTPRVHRQAHQLARRLERSPERHHRARLDGRTITSAELRVLHFLPSHFTLPRIAQELTVSTSTVKTQCLSLYRKLGVNSRSEAVTAARQLELLPR